MIRRVVEKRMAAVYEIDGRLLVRTVNSCGGAGIEADAITVLDGFPDLEARQLGQAVQAALIQCREIPMPRTWPSTPEYARPFLELSPRRYRSYRAWQRAARYAFVTASAESIRAERRFPDLGRGAWGPMPASPADRAWTDDVAMAPAAPADILGNALLTVLAAPPLRGP